MAHPLFTDEELLAWLDELLPIERMADVEQTVRESASLRQILAGLIHRRDQGERSVGEVWRRKRLTCPSRSRLGSYLLGTLDADLSAYIDFHIRTIGCRFCAANLYDLEQTAAAPSTVAKRRRRFFESSAGYLSRSRGDR